MIFAVRQLQWKCRDWPTHLSFTFVDLTKAFDTVNHEGLWKIMQKLDCPERFTQMMRQFHDGMMARVTDSGAVSKAFTGINQRMLFLSRVSTTAVHELLFVDDHVLKATSEVEKQRTVYLFAAVCDSFDLVINTEKTGVMYQSPPDAATVSIPTPN
ncbi:hypothetical protein SprV_0100364500 [Sparganum proliferum]